MHMMVTIFSGARSFPIEKPVCKFNALHRLALPTGLMTSLLTHVQKVSSQLKADSLLLVPNQHTATS